MIMKSVFKNPITSEEDLRTLIGEPSELVRNKVVTRLDHHCIDFISKSPFLTLATSDHSGYCDVSPRGDQPGFVGVLDDKHLVIPERPGNKRIDSMRNILSNPKIGLIFFIPGLRETLRINGSACLIKDEKILKKLSYKGKQPLVGIGIEVEECFIHCAKALIRSGLWNPDRWEDQRIFLSHLKFC